MQDEIKQLNKEWQNFKFALCKSFKIDKLVLWISKLITKGGLKMKVNIKGQGNENQLLTMLAWIEWCGNVGHTPKYLKVYIDGDGVTRLRFNFKDKEYQEKYEQIKENITNEWNHHKKDIEYVEL